jgi:hypothetical protein
MLGSGRVIWGLDMGVSTIPEEVSLQARGGAHRVTGKPVLSDSYSLARCKVMGRVWTASL